MGLRGQNVIKASSLWLAAGRRTPFAKVDRALPIVTICTDGGLGGMALLSST